MSESKNILWIKGGRVIDPVNQRDAISDLYAVDGKIVGNLTDAQKEAAHCVTGIQHGESVSPMGYITKATKPREP